MKFTPLKSFFIFVILVILGPSLAHAHDSRPLYIQMEETSATVAHLSWRTPPSIAPEQAPLVALAAPCAIIQQDTKMQRLSGSTLYTCPNGIADIDLTITYPIYNPSISSLVRIKFNSGEEHTNILNPSIDKWRIPSREAFLSVVKGYFLIGVRHILGGYDHLLFLAGLLYIARNPRRILITITGFTVAHSITIFLVALHVLKFSIPAIETVIALSIVFLGYEIVRNDRTTLTWRKPALVAAAFGLVHGAGFAVALSEIVLPQTETFAALLFFNLGVEAGQIAVLTLVFTLASITIHLTKPYISKFSALPLQTAAGYGLGILSALWFFQRLAIALA